MPQAQRINRRFQDATARLETILFLGAMLGVDGEESPALADFLEESPEVMRQCLPDMPDWLEKVLQRGDDIEVADEFNLWCERAPKLGFIVKVATPLFTLSAGGSASFSWGYYSYCVTREVLRPTRRSKGIARVGRSVCEPVDGAAS